MFPTKVLQLAEWQYSGSTMSGTFMETGRFWKIKAKRNKIIFKLLHLRFKVLVGKVQETYT